MPLDEEEDDSAWSLAPTRWALVLRERVPKIREGFLELCRELRGWKSFPFIDESGTARDLSEGFGPKTADKPRMKGMK